MFENSGKTQTPVAASMLVSVPAKHKMLDLKEADPEEPPPEGPQTKSLSADDPMATSMRELIPDYSDIPLVGLVDRNCTM